MFAGLFNPQRWNRYPYVTNAPTKYVDPTGEEGLLVFRQEIVGYDFVAALEQFVSQLPRLGGGGVYFGESGESGAYEAGGGVVGTPPSPPQPPTTTTTTTTTTTDGNKPDLIDVCLARTAELAAGFGDELTSVFGLTGLLDLPSGTEAIRDALDWDVVNKASGAYTGGEWAGTLWGLAYSGAAAAVRSGWTVTFDKYPTGGGAINVLFNGVRRAAADWNPFKLNGTMVNRPHLHYGSTKSQIKKHRPWQGGWRPYKCK